MLETLERFVKSRSRTTKKASVFFITAAVVFLFLFIFAGALSAVVGGGPVLGALLMLGIAAFVGYLVMHMVFKSEAISVKHTVIELPSDDVGQRMKEESEAELTGILQQREEAKAAPEATAIELVMLGDLAPSDELFNQFIGRMPGVMAGSKIVQIGEEKVELHVRNLSSITASVEVQARNADGIIIAYDATDRESFQNITTKWIPLLQKLNFQPMPCIKIVANKSDSTTREHKSLISDGVSEKKGVVTVGERLGLVTRLSQQLNTPVSFSSGTSADKTFESFAQSILEKRKEKVNSKDVQPTLKSLIQEKMGRSFFQGRFFSEPQAEREVRRMLCYIAFSSPVEQAKGIAALERYLESKLTEAGYSALLVKLNGIIFLLRKDKSSAFAGQYKISKDDTRRAHVSGDTCSESRALGGSVTHSERATYEEDVPRDLAAAFQFAKKTESETLDLVERQAQSFERSL